MNRSGTRSRMQAATGTTCDLKFWRGRAFSEKSQTTLRAEALRIVARSSGTACRPTAVTSVRAAKLRDSMARVHAECRKAAEWDEHQVDQVEAKHVAVDPFCHSRACWKRRANLDQLRDSTRLDSVAALAERIRWRQGCKACKTLQESICGSTANGKGEPRHLELCCTFDIAHCTRPHRIGSAEAAGLVFSRSFRQPHRRWVPSITLRATARARRSFGSL